MASKIRHSKFRHIDVFANKHDTCMQNITFFSGGSSDSSICDVSRKFIAVIPESIGGGSFIVIRLDEYGRFELKHPRVSGHESAVQDVKWSPFNDNIVASCSVNGSLKSWFIPDEGLTGTNLTECLVECKAPKKLTSLSWHPTAENIIASVCHDFTVIFWRMDIGEMIFTAQHTDYIFSFAWNFDGSLFATACKDKFIRCWDSHKRKVLWETQGLKGTKGSKLCFSGSLNYVISTGFSKDQQREVTLWINKEKSITMTLDPSNSVLYPFYDQGTNVITVLGKGDTTIRFYEVCSEDPHLQFLTLFQSKTPFKGFGFLPKSEVNFMICEIGRVYLLFDKTIQPSSIIVPRKASGFQEDLFTEFEAKECSMSADEWISGKLCGRRMIKFVPPGTKHEPYFIKNVKEMELSLVPSGQILIGSKVVSDNWEGSTCTDSYDLLRKEFEAKCQEVSFLKSQLEIQESKVLQLKAEILSLQSELKTTISDSNLEI